MSHQLVNQNREQEIATLTEAFERFSKETIQLEAAYTRLKQQFEKVNLQLADTNKKLRSNVHELNSIVTNMRQGLIFLQLDGSVVTYNPRAELILERERDDILGRPFDSLFDDHFFGFSIQHTLNSWKEPKVDRVSITSPSGKRKHLEVSVTLIENEGLLLLIRDITELLTLQRQSLRQDRMHELGEMAASVAHEIRNPLGGIEGFASLLKRDLSDHPEAQEMLDAIIAGVQRLNSLVMSILHYARPVDLNLEPTSLVPLLQEVCRCVQVDQHLNPQVVIHQRFPNPSPVLSLDPLLFKGAILNLLLNSYQAIEGEGSISVEIKKDEKGQVLIHIRDTGHGIPAENLEKIFSPFFTTKHEGNGFGLSEVHRVVQLHSGQIEVHSEVGEGTTVTVTLPHDSGEETWR